MLKASNQFSPFLTKSYVCFLQFGVKHDFPFPIGLHNFIFDIFIDHHENMDETLNVNLSLLFLVSTYRTKTTLLTCTVRRWEAFSRVLDEQEILTSARQDLSSTGLDRRWRQARKVIPSKRSVKNPIIIIIWSLVCLRIFFTSLVSWKMSRGPREVLITKFLAGGALGNSNLTMFSIPKAFNCNTAKLRSVLCISGGVFNGSWRNIKYNLGYFFVR